VFRPSFSRFYILPLLLLAGFVGLFCVVEYRKLSNDDQIRAIINDPISNMVHGIELSASDAKWVLELYHPGTLEPPQTSLMIGEALFDLKVRVDALSSFLSQNTIEKAEHRKQLSVVGDIMKLVDALGSADLYRDGIVDAERWVFARDSLEQLLVTTRQLHEHVKTEHQSKTSEILQAIGQDEKQRALLAVLVLIAGFALVLSLLDVVHQYQCNAERVRAAERYNALLAAALQNTHVGVLIRDMRRPDRPVVFINKAFTNLTGYAFQDIRGNSTGFLFGWKTEPTVIKTFHAAIEAGQGMTRETLLYRKDGSPFWVEWHLTPLLGEDGKLSHYVSLFNDMTSMREAQEDLIQAKLMAEHASAVKTNFLAMMSHEIRTPINGILGVLKLMQGANMDAEQQHMLSIAETSSRALHGIINDILDFAKMEAGKIDILCAPFSLNKLLDEVVTIAQPLIEDKTVELVLQIMPETPSYLVGDQDRLRQIFLNLVSNAIKFTDSGTVSIKALAMMEAEVEGKPGVLMRFEVQDTGLGISAEDQTILFKEFSQVERSFTRRYGGTGLGLAISKRLVTLMNGEIGVESQFGHGSKFWFMIPLQKSEGLEGGAAKTGERDSVSFVDPMSVRVLLVEDNETNRLVARRYLEKIGLSLDEAVNGAKAVELAASRHYDLILMDVSMPVMDGMMATCQIRALGGSNETIPIIALTAHAMEGDRQLCLAAGMNDYLNKPLDIVTLRRCMERWLKVKPADTASHLSASTGRNASLPVVTQTEQEGTQPNKMPIQVVDESLPLLDQDILAEMQEVLGGDTVRQVTDTFLADARQRITLFKTDDLQVIRDTAHTLKGCSSNCGLTRFYRLMNDLEQAAAGLDLEKTQAMLAAVEGLYQESSAALEQERDGFAEPKA